MLSKVNFRELLSQLEFESEKEVFYKEFAHDVYLKVDFDKQKLIYPEDKGFIVNELQTCNFAASENFVVFECVHRLLSQGYNPAHIELEPKWKVGHGASGGRADILIKDNNNKSYLIIECKTAGSEFDKAWNATQTRPTQLFSYAQQERSTQFIALYASDFIDNKVVANYFLINLFDPDDVLNSKKLKSYPDATTVEEIYQVWRDTYSRDYTSFGIFENNQAYHIGEHKPTLSVLKNIHSNDIQGKYHEFATILRQHNVSGRENAFDKLVNLFLCKVVDEKENPQELKFYWNGKAYDNPFDFQDRLQFLYKNGMEKFLGETITYIDNSQIDEAFAVFKNKPNATKDKIKEFLRAQKFFTNSDFAFIEVHNEKLFYQNFEVLLKIARMIQDISLTGSDENQFLGDMFEGFLDQGVKQSEGQFFTPMPIVKFIINSLPHKSNPQVIDYACGAGHFLNEYATNNQQQEKRIVGIEKEYRLSKVAKVSSFMYGSEIEIIYDDALKASDKIHDNSFDVLIANPPYSVKGFLETLSDDDRSKFELIKAIDEKSYTTNNAIECFFIERAKQLLAKDGVAGIIVPSSILNKGSKDNIYVATRETLLKYFDIVAIAEFGSGTFGKTGTNTVTLFLQRRNDTQDFAKHYQNMVDSWFDGDFISNQEFADNDLLERYCNHIALDVEIYQELLQNKLSNELFKHETFAEYKAEFEKLTDTKNRRNKKYYKDLTRKEQEQKETEELIKYIKVIEQDKLYYFCLAAKNARDVIIVKSPSDGKESKKFLGYDWSSAKGNEGIKYLTSNNISINDEDLEEEDKRILENLQGLKSINTPLYNPQNKADSQKINSIIANNFVGNNTVIPESLSSFVSKARLIDMLDFSRVEFNKAIGLSPNKKTQIIGKLEWQKKLGDVVDVLIGGTPSRSNSEYFEGDNLWVSISEMDGNIILDTKEKITDLGVRNSNVKLIPKGTTLLSFKLSIGKTAIAGKDLYTNEAIAGLVPKTKEITNKYIFHLFNGKIIDLEKDSFNVFGKSLNSAYLKNEVKIPLPPMDIQEQIVAECQKVDDEVSNAQQVIQTAKQSIEQTINSVNGEMTKLSLLTLKIGSGATPRGGEASYKESGVTLIRSQNIYDSGMIEDGLAFIDEQQATLLNNVIVEKDDVLFNITGASVARCCLVEEKYLPARVNQHVAIIRANEKILPKYLQQVLTSEKFKTDLLIIAKSSSTREAITKPQLENFRVKLISPEQQKEIVVRIEEFEDHISQAQQIIDNAKAQKQAILNKYLN